MNIPKEMNTYCGKCKGHSKHKVKIFKTGTRSKLKMGERKHLQKTKHGYGGKNKYIKTPKKQNKKPTFMLTCSKCSCKRYLVVPKRMKKIELKSDTAA